MTGLEQSFLTLWRMFVKNDDPEPQHRFAPPRRWRFDFAWADRRLAVEIDGGLWTRGRHLRGKGYQADIEKGNRAIELGWRVLHYTVDDINKRPVEMIEQVRACLNGTYRIDHA